MTGLEAYEKEVSVPTFDSWQFEYFLRLEVNLVAMELIYPGLILLENAAS